MGTAIAQEERALETLRTHAEQQAHLDALARPREVQELHCNSKGEQAVPLRSIAEQRKRCHELAQPRSSAEPVAKPWREELEARAQALVPDEVQAAQALLTEMRKRSKVQEDNARPRSRPSSAVG